MSFNEKHIDGVRATAAMALDVIAHGDEQEAMGLIESALAEVDQLDDLVDTAGQALELLSVGDTFEAMSLIVEACARHEIGTRQRRNMAKFALLKMKTTL